MGPGNRAPLSWPHPGFMLSLDFPIKAGIGAFLDGLDERVLYAGGRIYFAKDSRAKAQHIPQMYSRLDEWRTVRAKTDPDGVFISDLARRLELIPRG
jgi:decaprenylphospho-beta-D-ribofuranose 2-oxidase